MQAFAALFERIDQTTSTNQKVEIMTEFFRRQDAETSAWALFFLSGRKPKQLIGSSKLRQWAQDVVRLPDWLVADCYAAVGDTAEMIALMLSTGGHGRLAPGSLEEVSLGEWMTNRLLPLATMDEVSRRRLIVDWWQQLPAQGIFILNKLLTGSLRVGVSETLVYRSLATLFSLRPSVVAARLVGNWHPTAEFFLRLGRSEEDEHPVADDALLPVPFCLAVPLDKDPVELGLIDEWQCEWKWDGIRCQAVKRGAQVEIWSRGEERITDSFPDLATTLSNVPGDWILDGEILAGDWRRPRIFQMLQIRVNRRRPTKEFMTSAPVSFLAYDLLHAHGQSWRDKMLAERRSALETLIGSSIGSSLGISPVLAVGSWAEVAVLREQSRTHGAEGLMLKCKRTVYEAGRKRGVWFKWKVDPLSVDAVLTAAQPGTGRRASLYTDYTFSLWSNDTLVPIAKAYSGLSDTEIHELDGWIRRHTMDRFGPVRMVEARRVFEIGFEGISRSERHKSGFAVRFPRIIRERTDKHTPDANRVEDLTRLFESLSARSGPDATTAPTVVESSPMWEQMSLSLADEGDSS